MCFLYVLTLNIFVDDYSMVTSLQRVAYVQCMYADVHNTELRELTADSIFWLRNQNVFSY